MRKLNDAIARVGRKLNLADDWMNAAMALWITDPRRNDLFLGSVEQNEVVWASQNVKIFAFQWEWGLVSTSPVLVISPR